MPDSTPEQLADGTPARLGRYRLVRPISTGGMARVFEGRRESLAGVQPRVAIKVILPDFADNQPFQELFVHEARIGSLLQHQNLVQIQDFDCEEGRYYLVMEYVEGITLRRVVSLCRRHGIPIPLDLIAEIGRQICDGLDHAHSAVSEEGAPLNLVHRDIKPSNLMINPQGVVKLLDFGISKALIRREREGQVRGTWGYMAPEQADGESVGPAADLFGLAAVLYEMASFGPLFAEKDPDEVRPLLVQDEAARRAARLGRDFRGLGSVLVRALQRDPAARFPDAATMGRALSALISDPGMARDQLVRLQGRLTELNRPNAPDRPVAAPSAGPSSEQTVQPSGPGLPLAVGDAQGPAREPASHVERGGVIDIDLRRIAMPLFVLLAISILAFTAWHLWKEGQDVKWTTPSRATPDAAQESVVSEPVVPEPVVPAQATLPSLPAPAVPSAPPPAVPAAASPGKGLLTVSSLPRSKVSIDGEFVRFTPLYRSELPGGQHTVTLQTEDGQIHRFDVEVVPGKLTNRVWSFSQEDWVGG